MKADLPALPHSQKRGNNAGVFYYASTSALLLNQLLGMPGFNSGYLWNISSPGVHNDFVQMHQPFICFLSGSCQTQPSMPMQRLFAIWQGNVFRQGSRFGFLHVVGFCVFFCAAIFIAIRMKQKQQKRSTRELLSGSASLEELELTDV